MDYGKVKNFLVLTLPKHDKPIRINDTLLTVEETNQLIILLQSATKN